MANISRTITRTVKSPGSAVQIEYFGDWNRAKLVARGLEGAILAGGLSGQRAVANKIRELVRKKIRENGGSTHWPAYSQRYLDFKKKTKGSKAGQMYRYSDTYYNNIITWQSGTKIHVGLSPRVAVQSPGGKRKNITLHQLAQILEYGSSARGIPARPLWGPVSKEYGPAKMKALMVWHIRNAIRLRTGVSPKITL